MTFRAPTTGVDGLFVPLIATATGSIASMPSQTLGADVEWLATGSCPHARRWVVTLVPTSGAAVDLPACDAGTPASRIAAMAPQIRSCPPSTLPPTLPPATLSPRVHAGNTAAMDVAPPQVLPSCLSDRSGLRRAR